MDRLDVHLDRELDHLQRIADGPSLRRDSTASSRNGRRVFSRSERPMHEYSIVQALIERVEAEARARGASAVHRVSVRIGELSGVGRRSCSTTAYATFRDRTVCDARGARRRAWCPSAGQCPRCDAAPARGRPLRCPRCGGRGAPGGGRRNHARSHRNGGAVMCDTCGCGDPEIVAGRCARTDSRRQRTRRRRTIASTSASAAWSPSISWARPAPARRPCSKPTARRARGHRAARRACRRPRHRPRRRCACGGRHHRGSITTGSACHLDAEMVHRALHHLRGATSTTCSSRTSATWSAPPSTISARHANVVALSVTEGEDKPLKYPVMFRNADLVLITKIDLLPHLPDVRVDAIVANLERVMPRPRWLVLSARTGDGVTQWLSWLTALDRTPDRVAVEHIGERRPYGSRRRR